MQREVNYIGNNIESLSKETLEQLVDALLKRSNSIKLYSPTELSEASGLPKAKIYWAINSGQLRYVQFDGSAKKYIRQTDFEEFLETNSILLPAQEESFNEFETILRKRIKKGQALSKKLGLPSNTSSLDPSDLAKHLWQEGMRSQDLNQVIL